LAFSGPTPAVAAEFKICSLPRSQKIDNLSGRNPTIEYRI
jgi:hypothetical protein